ncbi:MAG: hypothetical protein JW803_04280 [Endomicrobiales bacterium]|nr:hypothetical protein [Endomicrobiales bacterium]
MSNSNYFIPIDSKLEQIFYAVYKRKCAYCKQDIALNDARIAHIIPVGKNTLHNYILSCSQCNPEHIYNSFMGRLHRLFLLLTAKIKANRIYRIYNDKAFEYNLGLSEELLREIGVDKKEFISIAKKLDIKPIYSQEAREYQYSRGQKKMIKRHHNFKNIKITL